MNEWPFHDCLHFIFSSLTLIAWSRQELCGSQVHVVMALAIWYDSDQRFGRLTFGITFEIIQFNLDCYSGYRHVFFFLFFFWDLTILFSQNFKLLSLNVYYASLCQRGFLGPKSFFFFWDYQLFDLSQKVILSCLNRRSYFLKCF